MSALGGGTDGGLASAGSQRHLQVYVNERVDELNQAIRSGFSELAAADIAWRSPLASDRYREYWDRAFLEAIEQSDHAEGLAAFWPRGGPHWDGLAVVLRPGFAPGALLVEAKAHVSELLKGSLIGASVSPTSRRQIELAMAWAQDNLGISDRTPASWCDTPLYQSANRLAHLQWMNNRGIDTWLVHVFFAGDDHVAAASNEEWEAAAAEADRQLGLTAGAATRAAHVVLEAT